MSVESEILRIQHNIADAYTKVAEKGGKVPLQPNSKNLAEAITSIPESEGVIAGDGMSKEGNTLNVDNPVRGILTQAEFDALSEAQKASGTYFVDDGQSGSCGEIYDDQERVIGTWFGKPLYSRTLQVTMPSIEGKWISLGVTIDSFSMLVDVVYNMDIQAEDLQIAGFNTAAQFAKKISTNELMVILNSASTNKFANVTIKYTKTTDLEVSA